MGHILRYENRLSVSSYSTTDNEELRLPDLIEQCGRMIVPLAESRGISVRWDASDVVLAVDVRATRQILINLLSNAVKFSAESGVIQITGRSGDEGFVVIDVIDQGIGIPADKITEITRPFYQIDDGLNRSHDGAGLGLAIASQLVSLLGGRMDIHSELGKGTRVSVMLPLHPHVAAA